MVTNIKFLPSCHLLFRAFDVLNEAMSKTKGLFLLCDSCSQYITPIGHLCKMKKKKENAIYLCKKIPAPFMFSLQIPYSIFINIV